MTVHVFDNIYLRDMNYFLTSLKKLLYKGVIMRLLLIVVNLISAERPWKTLVFTFTVLAVTIQRAGDFFIVGLPSYVIWLNLSRKGVLYFKSWCLLLGMFAFKDTSCCVESLPKGLWNVISYLHRYSYRSDVATAASPMTIYE